MKNLKRALSFALATVMLIGMMVVGASAASFGDADEIVNTDAVNTMVALGIIKGKDNGNFDPEGIVTRAEMAKMICVALNGGKDPNLAGGGLYPDTKGHWAAGYIDYCTNMGIVSGDTAGNFNPDKTVTGTEAAKMILIALGYNAKTEKFVNDANWAININVKASTKGLYDDVAVLPEAGLSRDDAAQMLFNGIQAEMVKYEMVGITGGEGISQAVDREGKTILSEKYNTYDSDKTPEDKMTKVEWVSAKKEWKYTIGTGATKKEFNSAEDFTDLMGQNVKVIANKTTQKVYGIFAEDSSVLAEGFTTDLTLKTADDEVELAGETYDLETCTAIDFMTGATADLTALGSVKLIDTDDDNKVDTIVMVPFTFEKVTYVGKTSFTAGASYKFEDVNVYDGIAKNDYVTITAKANTTKNKIAIAEVEVVSGTVSGIKGGKYLVDGEWMTLNTGVTAPAVNDTIDYIAFGSVIYYAKVTDGETVSDDLALVITTGTENTGSTLTGKTYKAKLIFTDGTKKTVETDKDYDDVANGDLVGKLVTYTINNKDKYVLKAVSDDNKAGYDGFSDAAITGTKIETIGGKEVADDAVIFVFKGTVGTAASTNDAKIITGKDAKSLTTANYPNAIMALNEKVNGFTYTTMAVIGHTTNDLPGTLGDTNYGYLTADAYKTRANGKNYINFTIWTADGELVVKDESDATDLTAFVAGSVVTYKVVDDAIVDDVTVITPAIGAVTGWDGDEKIQIDDNASTKVTEDTTVIYIDSDEQEGVEGGAIAIADEPKTGYFVPNVMYIDGTDELDLLIVDVNNKMAGTEGSKVSEQPADRAGFLDQYAGYTGDNAGFQNWGYLPSVGLEQTVIGDTVFVSGKLTDVLTQVGEDDKIEANILAGLNYAYFTGITTPDSLKTAIVNGGFGFTAVEKVGFIGLEKGTSRAVSCVVYGTTSNGTGMYCLKWNTAGNTQTTFQWKGLTCDISGLSF